MKILSSWLNELTGLKLSAKEQAERLERAGIEIEQIISSSKLDKNIVAAQITKVTQHPNADRLKLVDVTDGKQLHHIVCGAPNVREDMIVALAKIGTMLPDGTEIKQAVIRGEESKGMLCSAAELGMSDDHDGLFELDPTTPVGTTLCDIVGSCEILDLTTAYNRSDLVSAIGLSREIAAFSGSRLGEPEIPEPKGKSDGKLVGSVVKNVVKRYLLAHVKLGKTSKTPQWMAERLVASGIRPINIVVDITNYVLVEYGQPLHAFDAANVALPVSVRLPRRGETKLTTLDGVERPLFPDDLIISDSTTPLALAGVMGGLTSEIIPETAELLLEAASFDGSTVRAMAVRHGLRTEASSRFERNLPPHLAELGMNRAIELLEEYCDATVLGISKDIWQAPKQTVVTLSPERVGALLGQPVAAATSKKLLELLGFSVKLGKNMEVTVPWWRPDVAQAADIIEEVSRSLGYDDLPATLPAWRPQAIEFDKRWSRIWQLKALLRGLGLDEVATYSFVSHQQLTDFGHNHKSHLKLKNPLSVEQAYLRSSMAPSLVNTVARNARQVSDIGIFEISKVFEVGAKLSELPREPLQLGLAVQDKNAYARVKAAIDLVNREFKLGLVIVPKNHPMYLENHSAEIMRGKQSLGWIGELAPEILTRHKLRESVGYIELDLESWIEEQPQFAYKPVSRFPSIARDLSLELDQEVTWDEIQVQIKGENLQEVQFLNDYYGKELPAGKKSMAVRLVFSSLERTLTDKEVDVETSKVVKHLVTKFHAKLRD
jgi:phenylalanyl-tRNA synthetase beta chain